jgi:hypothetical protein
MKRYVVYEIKFLRKKKLFETNDFLSAYIIVNYDLVIAFKKTKIWDRYSLKWL